jgi:hypothetical protein
MMIKAVRRTTPKTKTTMTMAVVGRTEMTVQDVAVAAAAAAEEEDDPFGRRS